MHSKIEVEYKTLCTKEQFERLLNLYPNHKVIKQTNTYFDTTPSLKERGIAIRLRQIGDDVLFTLKKREERGNEEIEFPVPCLSLDSPAIQNILHPYHIQNLEVAGILVTTRHLVEFEHAELCLDINEYNNHIDYEIEYELKDADVDTFDEFSEILNQANIPYIPNKRSKIQRCIETNNNQ